MTYKIVRHFFKGHRRTFIHRQTLMTGLTLEEAQEHCSHPETSSVTCTTPEGKALTKASGPWFDTYYQE
jgi:hypothetical protein